MSKVIAIVGATATGKSSLAIALAKALGGEVISGDSAQVYRGMDIGTAKATRQEMEGIPHHLIDILDIEEPFSAGLFAEKGSAAAWDIIARGKTPIVVGGTGMYVDVLTGKTRLSQSADSDPGVRASLMKKAEQEGAQALHDYLKTVDPVSAAEIHPNNVKRVARAIEIYLVTGKTKSELNSAPAPAGAFSRKLILLHSEDRARLYDRIDARVDEMIEQGLVEEARTLWEKGLGDTPTASAAIGYKELFPYFCGVAELAPCVAAIKQATRNYAKRQVTYFKRMEDACVLDCFMPKAALFEKALAICKEFL